MIEIMISIILAPLALASIAVSGAIIVGAARSIKNKKK
jgi:hypothetical protein